MRGAHGVPLDEGEELWSDTPAVEREEPCGPRPGLWEERCCVSASASWRPAGARRHGSSQSRADSRGADACRHSSAPRPIREQCGRLSWQLCAVDRCQARSSVHSAFATRALCGSRALGSRSWAPGLRAGPGPVSTHDELRVDDAAGIVGAAGEALAQHLRRDAAHLPVGAGSRWSGAGGPSAHGRVVAHHAELFGDGHLQVCGAVRHPDRGDVVRGEHRGGGVGSPRRRARSSVSMPSSAAARSGPITSQRPPSPSRSVSARNPVRRSAGPGRSTA